MRRVQPTKHLTIPRVKPWGKKWQALVRWSDQGKDKVIARVFTTQEEAIEWWTERREAIEHNHALITTPYAMMMADRIIRNNRVAWEPRIMMQEPGYNTPAWGDDEE
jgi:hypothetical protein